jgi:hypothetical protein
MGRPRKYATAAEKARAYRERYAVIDVRLKPETVATLDKIALARDESRANLVAQLIAYALANPPGQSWYVAPRFSRPVAPMTQRRRAETKYLRELREDDEGEFDA